MAKTEISLNVLLIYILSAILLSAFGVQLFLNERPCPLCFLQRVGMLGVAAGAALNIKFGARPAHYGLILLSSLMGGAIALRQIALHACPGTPAFGIPVFGLSLYTWSFLVFASTTLLVSILLFLHSSEASSPMALNKWSKGAIYLILFVAVANIVSTLLLCGFGPCAE